MDNNINNEELIGEETDLIAPSTDEPKEKVEVSSSQEEPKTTEPKKKARVGLVIFILILIVAVIIGLPYIIKYIGI